MNNASMERLYQVLLAPHVSEKSNVIAEKNRQITFRVLPDATKSEIKAAVETIFKVTVEAVQVVNSRGKIKRFGRTPGRRSRRRRAYVRLAPGQDIDFANTDFGGK